MTVCSMRTPFTNGHNIVIIYLHLFFIYPILTVAKNTNWWAKRCDSVITHHAKRNFWRTFIIAKFESSTTVMLMKIQIFRDIIMCQLIMLPASWRSSLSWTLGSCSNWWLPMFQSARHLHAWGQKPFDTDNGGTKLLQNDGKQSTWFHTAEDMILHASYCMGDI